jgi:hypothetical protein
MSRQKKILVTIGSIVCFVIFFNVLARLTEPERLPEKWVNVQYGGVVDVNDRSVFENGYSRSLACNDGIGHESPDRCVSGVWYDRQNRYMIIGLGEKPRRYYHYCDFPPGQWTRLIEADHLYNHYSNSIRERFDCRSSARLVPQYAK